MFVTGKTLIEVKAGLEQDQCRDITTKLMVENENGSVVRLKYKEDYYSDRSWRTETHECTTWIIVKDDICQGSFEKYRLAKTRIGIRQEKTRFPKRIIRNEDALEFYLNIRDAARASSDRAYCGIIAYCNLTHSSYEEGRKLCSKYGWDHKGMRTCELLLLLRDQGYEVLERREQIRQHAKTIKSFEEQGFRENYLILINGHFASSINGTLTDHTHGKKCIIKDVWEVTKK